MEFISEFNTGPLRRKVFIAIRKGSQWVLITSVTDNAEGNCDANDSFAKENNKAF